MSSNDTGNPGTLSNPTLSSVRMTLTGPKVAIFISVTVGVLLGAATLLYFAKQRKRAEALAPPRELINSSTPWTGGTKDGYTECPICHIALDNVLPDELDHDQDQILLQDLNNENVTTTTTTTTTTPKNVRKKKPVLKKPSRIYLFLVGLRNKAPDPTTIQLKSCKHAFHTSCLMSWYRLKRYDCPICRSVYYRKTQPV